MAKEYIEREAFIKRLEHEADLSSDIINLLILNGIANIVRDENIAPAADVVEVVHGEWLDNGDRDSNGVPKPFAISCSICGSSAGTDWMKYCPNCGAKMDGERKCEDGRNNNSY